MSTRERGTKERIILAVERLVAERGIGSVPLRDITYAAGQRNSSAIRYHFGPKPDLLRAVFEYRMGQVNERRLELLAHMHAIGTPSTVRSLVDAWIRPLVAVTSEPDCFYARFLAQLSADPNYHVADDWHVASSLVAVREGIRRALPPDLPEGIFAERWRMAIHLLVHTVADQENVSLAELQKNVDGQWGDWVSRLVDACIGVLTGFTGSGVVGHLQEHVGASE
ncbi:TetR/AcrR family transcriptional regulator [Pseudonocardia sp. RS010]|uniref:TetR/AcrR family transcriptional regulator n=1 Tax=Pseudonocardia sp. RS010 TaxID=3385979 RepID=UPI0039A024A9